MKSLYLFVCLGCFKAAPHQGSDLWPLISTFTVELFINAAHARTVMHTHSTHSRKETYPLRGRSWEDWVPLGMSHQPVEAAGGEMWGEEPWSPWQQHTYTVNRARERERGREYFHCCPLNIFCVCACARVQVSECVCGLTFWQISYSTGECVYVGVCV